MSNLKNFPMNYKGQLKIDIQSWYVKALWGLELIMSVKLCTKVINLIYQHILHLGIRRVTQFFNSKRQFQNVNAINEEIDKEKWYLKYPLSFRILLFTSKVIVTTLIKFIFIEPERKLWDYITYFSYMGIIL